MSGNDWTYWTDYDSTRLGQVAEADQQEVWTRWLQERINRNVLVPLKRIKEDDIEPVGQENYSALLIYSVSICCAIEAMGKYLTGATHSPPGNGDRFRKFVQEYMHSDYYAKQLDGKLYVEYLWSDFRNGLAHGFAIARGKFEQKGSDDYFVESTDINNNDVLSLNWDKLFDDFEQACEEYFEDVRKADGNAALVDSFKRVFRQVCINRS